MIFQMLSTSSATATTSITASPSLFVAPGAARHYRARPRDLQRMHDNARLGISHPVAGLMVKDLIV
jgi:tRNA(Met) C34 N-acetyltransferase TmcA